MFNKYGVKHAMHSEDIKKRIKDYFIEKYGLDNPSKVREVREKAENTMFNKYGVKHALNSNIFLEKLFNTNLLRYGNKSFTRTDKYLKSISSNIFNKNSNIVNNYNYLLIKCDNSEYLIRCNKCNSSFTIQRQLWRNRNSTDSEICLICNPIINGISKGEKMLLSYISSIYDGFIIENYKINKKEIDIYLPELKIGFEFNGLYWHSELNKNKKYHLDKVNFFNTNGIQVTLIWEDDWEYKKDIVKSIILNKLGKSKRIFARKCIIRDVDNRDVRDFLVRNHIQGFVGSKVKLGLYYNNELISLMTFGNLRKSLGQKSYDGSYELLRFCNKLNTSVVGGASKLFSYFIKNYEVKEVISYSDNSRGVGNLYNKLGFKFLYNSVPNYYWCKNGIKYNRFNYRKDKLLRNGGDVNKTEVQIMHDKGHYRIFDCGSGKWLFENLYIQ